MEKYHFFLDSYPEVNKEVFNKEIDNYLCQIANLLSENSNNKVSRKLKLWKEYYSTPSTIHSIAERNAISARIAKYHIASIDRLLLFYIGCKIC